MNFFSILLFVFCLTPAFANGVIELKYSDTALAPASAKITNVRKLCPVLPGEVQCMAIGSIITVKVSLNGCLDRFGGYFSKFEVIENKGFLFLGVINILNQGSRFTRCTQAPSKILELHVPFEGDIQLVKTEFIGNKLPQL